MPKKLLSMLHENEYTDVMGENCGPNIFDALLRTHSYSRILELNKKLACSKVQKAYKHQMVLNNRMKADDSYIEENSTETRWVITTRLIYSLRIYCI